MRRLAENGYARPYQWDGTRRKYAPHAVSHYQYAPIDTCERESNSKRRLTFCEITDPDLVERARQLGAETPDKEVPHA